MGFPDGSASKEYAGSAGDTVQSLGPEDPQEEETATHPSILAWEIPWTEEHGRLQSQGSQRIGHNWVTKHTHAHTAESEEELKSLLMSVKEESGKAGLKLNIQKKLRLWHPSPSLHSK